MGSEKMCSKKAGYGSGMGSGMMMDDKEDDDMQSRKKRSCNGGPPEQCQWYIDMYGNGDDDEEATEKPESDKPEGDKDDMDMSGDKDDMDMSGDKDDYGYGEGDDEVCDDCVHDCVSYHVFGNKMSYGDDKDDSGQGYGGSYGNKPEGEGDMSDMMQARRFH